MKLKPHSATDFISSCEIQTLSSLPQAPPFLRIFFQDGISASQLLSYRSLQTLRLISAWIKLYGFTQLKIWCQRMFNEFQRGNHQHRSEFKFHTNASQCFMGRTAANQHTFYSCLFLICIWTVFYATSSSICFESALFQSTGSNVLYRYLVLIWSEGFSGFIQGTLILCPSSPPQILSMSSKEKKIKCNWINYNLDWDNLIFPDYNKRQNKNHISLCVMLPLLAIMAYGPLINF